MGEKLDYLQVLKALDEIPFGVGKKLLIDFLQGISNNESIRNNRLYKCAAFGSLGYGDRELEEVIDNLITNGLIRIVGLNGNKFAKLLELSQKGREELKNPALYKRKLCFNFKEAKTDITEEDKKEFEKYNDFLLKYTDEQKKAILCRKKQVLCIAGAGSGKTTVLTKRAEYVVKHSDVAPEKVLAITFTRKARREMAERLEKAGQMEKVSVETFNSFCEKLLKKHNDCIYEKPVRVLEYKDRIHMINNALEALNLDLREAVDIYFRESQQRGKTDEQLANIFINDCFFIRDYFKFKHKPISREFFEISGSQEKSVSLVLSVCNYIEAYMTKHGLRDFADQLIDTILLFEKHPELIPCFEHILVDEYQDVNSTQIKLIELLKPENIFAVGDPRQSIYGWRGSDIRYILNFEDKYPECEVITLTKNYRSTKQIVTLINEAIKSMGLPDLEGERKEKSDIRLLDFSSEFAEFEFVLQAIMSSLIPRHEIFVLARTNKQLNDLSQIMKSRGIKHVVRSDELVKSVIAMQDEVILATIHAIKGLEAEMVFVIGCTPINFPCKGSEHPVIEMVKVEEYDKEEEEKRLFYVAMSRAKKNLYLSYTGSKPTSFITDSMLDILEHDKEKQRPKHEKSGLNEDLKSVQARLQSWRARMCRELEVPAFMIMHDRTLIEISQKMPASTEELEEIHGLGAVKIAKYGEEILDIVNGK
ncbi:MAG: UvrD-helicase domain-containing protein [Candidatus Woesearchaeota archaeon]